MATTELNRKGWHLSESGLLQCTGNDRFILENVIKKALNTDLREIGSKWLNEDINKGRLDYIEGPTVLQLQKLRVISAPKDNEDSQVAPRLCRLSLTDGHTTCSAVTLEPVKGLGANTPPGSKLLLAGTVEVETSFLLLNNKNTTLIGGRVDNLADPWELKKTLAKQSQLRGTIKGQGGPPPYVPFGKKISNEPLPPPRKDNFKSLGATKENKLEEDSEFQQQRQATINQALQAKGGGAKTFGGGQKQLINDKDLARIVEMGFLAEEGTSALKASGGNVEDAINSLLSGSPRYHKGGERGGRGGRRGGSADVRGEGRSEKGEGRRRGRDRGMEEDLDPANSRPSGPATLFDFLETKIPAKDDSKKTKKPSSGNYALLVQSQTPSSASSYNNVSSKSTQDQNSKIDKKVLNTQSNPTFHLSSRPSSQYGSQRDRGFHNGHEDTDEGGGGHRRQQQHNTLPPRFARIGRGDGGQQDRYEGKGAGRYEGKDFEGGREGKDSWGGASEREGGERIRYEGKDSGGRGSRRENGEKINVYDGKNSVGRGRGSGRFNRGEDDRPGRERRFDNKPIAYSNQNQKENTQDRRNRRSNTYNASQDSRNQLNQTKPRQNDKQQQQWEQGSDKSVKQPFGQPNEGEGYGGSRDSYQNQNSSDGNWNQYNKGNSKGEVGQGSRSNQSRSNAYSTPTDKQYGYQGQMPYNNQPYQVSNGVPLSRGDTCLAKYWEDNEMYPAVIEAMAPDGSTVVVTFLEYGNQEEVFVGDVQPLQQPGWQTFTMPPPPVYEMGGVERPLVPDPSQYQGAPAFVPAMEFTRGGSYYNPGGRRQDGGDRRKPTQSYYQLQNKKNH